MALPDSAAQAALGSSYPPAPPYSSTDAIPIKPNKKSTPLSMKYTTTNRVSIAQWVSQAGAGRIGYDPWLHTQNALYTLETTFHPLADHPPSSGAKSYRFPMAAPSLKSLRSGFFSSTRASGRFKLRESAPSIGKISQRTKPSIVLSSLSWIASLGFSISAETI